jgi:hypothetical protein
LTPHDEMSQTRQTNVVSVGRAVGPRGKNYMERIFIYRRKSGRRVKAPMTTTPTTTTAAIIFASIVGTSTSVIMTYAATLHIPGIPDPSHFPQELSASGYAYFNQRSPAASLPYPRFGRVAACLPLDAPFPCHRRILLFPCRAHNSGFEWLAGRAPKRGSRIKPLFSRFNSSPATPAWFASPLIHP